MIRKIVIACLISILAGTAIFNSFPIVPYLLEQARGQAKMIFGARNIEAVLEDPAIPDSIKVKLKLIQEIRTFSIDELGLNANKNYTSYYAPKANDNLLLLTATKPYSFENYEWSFPIIGKVSYKGFFNHERAQTEMKELAAMDYDTDLGRVAAWSTLGWFKDPVTSGMLKRQEGQLADLIIHEISHGTIYIKDQTELNENIASFIGVEGARKFLKKKFGADSKELESYVSRQKDEKIFSEFVLDCMKRLETLYKSFPKDAEDSYKSIQKYILISQFYNEISNLPLTDPDRAKRIFGKDPYPNNTFFMSFKRYQFQQDEILEKFNELDKNIEKLIKYYKELYK